LNELRPKTREEGTTIENARVPSWASWVGGTSDNRIIDGCWPHKKGAESTLRTVGCSLGRASRTLRPNIVRPHQSHAKIVHLEAGRKKFHPKGPTSPLRHIYDPIRVQRSSRGCRKTWVSALGRRSFAFLCLGLNLRPRLAWKGRDESKRRRAESQWIVAARPLCHLQYPVAYLSRLQRIQPVARSKQCCRAADAARRPRRRRPRRVPLGAGRPLLRDGRRARGASAGF
jgi:hypothetical protein